MSKSNSYSHKKFSDPDVVVSTLRFVSCLTAKTDFTKSVFDLIEYRGLSQMDGAWVDQTRRRIDAKEVISDADRQRFDKLYKQILGLSDDQDPPSGGTPDTEGEGSDDPDEDGPDGFERSITDRPLTVSDEEDEKEKAKGERSLQIGEPQAVQTKEPIQDGKKNKKRQVNRSSRKYENVIG